MRSRNILLVALGASLLAIPVVASSQARGTPFQRLIEALLGHEERIQELEACSCCCEGVFEPVCGADGRTWLNACEAECAGVAVVAPGECPPECLDDAACATGEFCSKPAGACDASGTCRPRPEVCPDVWDPVCGCDGLTYGNDCEAAAAGVNVAHPGECARSCFGDVDCGAGEFCGSLPGACNGPRECQAVPEACPEIFDPVCGCDGVTYGNACFAAGARVGVAHPGECRAACGNGVLDPGEECDDGNVADGDGCDADCTFQFCGGIAGFTCPEPYVCVDDPRDDCDPQRGGADCGGICVLR